MARSGYKGSIIFWIDDYYHTRCLAGTDPSIHQSMNTHPVQLVRGDRSDGRPTRVKKCHSMVKMSRWFWNDHELSQSLIYEFGLSCSFNFYVLPLLTALTPSQLWIFWTLSSLQSKEKNGTSTQDLAFALSSSLTLWSTNTHLSLTIFCDASK